MDFQELNRRIVPVAYAHLMLDVASKLGVEADVVLRSCNIKPALLEDADTRLTVMQGGMMLLQVRELTGCQAIGYEIGLHSQLTSHGLLGYGLMSQSNLREAIEWGSQFVKLRLPDLSTELFIDGKDAVIEVNGGTSFGPLRECMFDTFMVGLARMAPAILNREFGEDLIEIWFDYPEPEYFADYRSRLPTARFDMGKNQLRFPSKFVDVRLETANPVTVKMVADQLDRELEQLGIKGDLLGQVRAILRHAAGEYPGLDSVAERLCMSSRTLKRRLKEKNETYKGLIEELRQTESIRMLKDTHLSIENIAVKLGYSDPANFTRAFKKWKGLTPSAFRQQSTH